MKYNHIAFTFLVITCISHTIIIVLDMYVHIAKTVQICFFQLRCLLRVCRLLGHDVDLGAGAEAVKAQLKNIRAEASRISVEPKLQNVSASRSERRKIAAHFSVNNAF